MIETDTFDFIVVGAGSAGAAAAVRLAQAGKHRILLLEAGPPDTSFWSRIPIGVGTLLAKGMYVRDFFTEPDPQLNNRRIYWPRGWVVGGCSTINGLMWVHGTPREYDRWAEDGCTGWAWSDLADWFRKIESYAKGDPAYRGLNGPVGVTEFQPVDEGPDAFLDALQASGVGKRVGDYNAGGVGGSYVQFNTRRGLRSSMREAYLDPNKDLPNLTIMTGVLATRVLMQGKHARGIVARAEGRELTLHARKEVILCGGTFNSAQLLELSGIGRREVLDAAGIPLLHELRMVGENLSEHVYSPITFRCKPGISWNRRLNSPIGKLLDGARWLLRRDGRLTSATMTAHGFVPRSPADMDPQIKLQIQQASAPGNRGKSMTRLDPFDGVTLASFQISPYSRGSSHIVNADPAAAPRLISNHFTDPRDIETSLVALRKLRQVAAAAPMARWLLEELRPGPRAMSDEALIEYMRATSATAYHPVGTCRMGLDATQSVVDPSLRIHGVSGLRVADCSVMPSIASTNTNAIAIVIGERVADFILADA